MELTIEQLIDKIADRIYDAAVNAGPVYEQEDFIDDLQDQWKNLLRKMVEKDDLKQEARDETKELQDGDMCRVTSLQLNEVCTVLNVDAYSSSFCGCNSVAWYYNGLCPYNGYLRKNELPYEEFLMRARRTAARQKKEQAEKRIPLGTQVDYCGTVWLYWHKTANGLHKIIYNDGLSHEVKREHFTVMKPQ